MTATESVTITLRAPSGANEGEYFASFADWLHAQGRVFLAGQIEAQLPKPKPEEPKRLGAVVLDRSGSLWLRVVGPGFNRPWAEVGVNKHYGFAAQVETETSYSHIDAVAVLSEGVTA